MPQMACPTLDFVFIGSLVFFAGHAEGGIFPYVSLKYMHANPGDRIACKIKAFFLVDHWLLASDRPGHFINVEPAPGNSHSYWVNEVHYSAEGSMSSVNWCRNHGPGRFGPHAVDRARVHLHSEVYYHLLTCNCEHYVDAWAGNSLCNNQVRFLTLMIPLICPTDSCRKYLP